MSDETVTLTDGSEVDREIFDNLKTTLQTESASEFQDNRFDRPKADDPVTPFTAEPLATVRNVAEREHAERSARAQHVDEEYNAPIAPDYETWANNKNRYDLAGVDTIPQDERDRRGQEAAEQAKEAGLIDEINRTELSGNRRGQFNTDDPRELPTGEEPDRRIDAEPDLDQEYPVFQEGPVLAHETGHAIDFAVGVGERFGSQGDFFAGRDADLKGQAIALTERVRGSIAPAEQAYREDERELVADAFAAMAIEPRAAQREAPDLVNALRTEFVEYVDKDDQLPL
jgi:hypothetical protein